MKFDSLLVIVDPTQAVPRLLGKVIRLARAFRPRIELFVCDTEESSAGLLPERPAGTAGLAEQREQLRQKRLASLELLAAPVRELGHTVSANAIWHAPLHEGIVRHVLQTKPDLVIKESRTHLPMEREFTTHTDWLLVRDCPAPLLLVKRDHWPDHLRLTAAVDPCRPAERPESLDYAILDASGTLARGLGAQREVFHVFEGPAHLPDETVTREATMQAHARAREAMRKLLAGQTGLKHLHYLEGDPVSLVPQHVESGAFDILVMGAASRSRPTDPFVGGTAARVLEAVSCDVLVVKPDGFISPMLTTAPAPRL
jgi:universal stress protein E